MDELTTRRNDTEHRYEGWLGDELAGILDYTEDRSQVVFTHAETRPEFEGRGVGSTIVRYALDDVRAGGDRTVVPRCPFVRDWIDRHPDYSSLVASSANGR